MSWSIKIGRVFGIGLYLHFTFLILLGFLGFGAYAATGSMEFALMEMGFILLLFGIVTLHELGHALAAKYYGIPTRDITLLPIGGLARLERIPRDGVKEFVIAIAGPMVNVVLAGIFLVAVFFTHGTLPWGIDQIMGSDLLNRLFWVNVILVVFNMIPAYPMDGGRILRASLAMTMNHDRATRIATGIGQVLAVGFGILGFMTGHFILMLIALFVWMGAAQEGAMARLRMSLGGASVRRVMLTRFEVVAPHDTLGMVLQQALIGLQKDFPVWEDGKLVGMLTRDDLREALQRDSYDGWVADAMRPVAAALDPADSLDIALERMQENNAACLPVLQEGHLIGLVTVEKLQEYVSYRQYMGSRQAQGNSWFGSRRGEQTMPR